MGRPTISAAALSESSQTNEEIQERIENEKKFRGKADKIFPPTDLTENQKFLFNYIKEELIDSGLLSNLDVYILSTFVIAIDRLQYLEGLINNNPKLMFRSDVMSAKDKYTKDQYRCTNELSLSPQARSKISNIIMQNQKDKQDPLLKALNEDD